MKKIIQRVMKACNENSTQATGSMVKFQDNKLVAYGGTFCIQIPVPVDADCAFKPSTLLAFHRKTREGASYTVKNNKLRVRHKRESVTMPCLPSEKMPILDVFKEMRPTKWLPQPAVKALVQCVDPSYPVTDMQGVLIRDSEMVGANGKVMIAIPCDIGGISIVIPIDTMKFLATCEEKVIGYAFDGAAFKLWFEGGMTVCTRIIGSSDFPDIGAIFDQKGKSFKISEDIVEDLKTLDCDLIELTPKGLRYTADENSIGAIRAEVEGDYRFCLNKKDFDIIFKINKGVKFFTNDTNSIVIGNGGKRFRSAVSVMRDNVFTKHGA